MTTVQYLFGADVFGEKAHHVSHKEPHAGCFTGGDHLLSIAQVAGHWLFADDILARGSRGQYHVFVRGCRRADVHHIHLGQQRLQAGKGPPAERYGGGLCPFRRTGEKARQFEAIAAVAQQPVLSLTKDRPTLGVHPPGQARADDAYPLHASPPPPSPSQGEGWGEGAPSRGSDTGSPRSAER